MDTKFIDWHTADIIAALRKKAHHWLRNLAAMA